MNLLPRLARLVHKLLFTELRVPSWVVVLGAVAMLAYSIVGALILSMSR